MVRPYVLLSSLIPFDFILPYQQILMALLQNLPHAPLLLSIPNPSSRHCSHQHFSPNITQPPNWSDSSLSPAVPPPQPPEWPLRNHKSGPTTDLLRPSCSSCCDEKEGPPPCYDPQSSKRAEPSPPVILLSMCSTFCPSSLSHTIILNPTSKHTGNISWEYSTSLPLPESRWISLQCSGTSPEVTVQI